MQNSLTLLEATYQEKIERVLQQNEQLMLEIQKAKTDVVLKDEYDHLQKKLLQMGETSRDLEKQIEESREEKKQIKQLYNSLLAITNLSIKNAD